jgi:hypothetical protein
MAGRPSKYLHQQALAAIPEFIIERVEFGGAIKMT